MIQHVLRKLIQSEDLSRTESARVMQEIADGKATHAQIGAFLALMQRKGETADEIAGAAEVMRQHSTCIGTEFPDCLDTCGTGGDGTCTFNISTAAALVAAGAGATVAKHGNRAVSSRAGSADVLAALGVRVEAPMSTAVHCLRELGIAFLFAPHYYPAFHTIADLRRTLGFRTLFNLLGPLVNPSGARRQLLGVYASHQVPIMGRVLHALGTEYAFVVHGGGLDEIALNSETEVCEVKGDTIREYRICPEDLGLIRTPLRPLIGGDAQHNATIIRAILQGERGAPREVVALNAAAALVAAQIAKTLKEGLERAFVAIDSGAANHKLQSLIKLTQSHP